MKLENPIPWELTVYAIGGVAHPAVFISAETAHPLWGDFWADGMEAVVVRALEGSGAPDWVGPKASIVTTSDGIYVLREEGLADGETVGVAPLEEVATLHKPNLALIQELEGLLEGAMSGRLRGLLFAGFVHGSDVYRYGSVGEYSLPEFALGVKFLELEVDSLAIAARSPEPE